MKQVGQYTFIKKIGKGHYAQVYQAEHTKTKKIVAVKCLQRDGISNNQLKNIENEVLVLEKTNHPNIVAMIDRMKSKNSYYLILEYCNGGDLASFVQSHGQLSEVDTRNITKQIVEGMNHLHNLGVLHRDLKLANILVHFPTMPTPVDSPLLTHNADWLNSSHLLSEQPFLIKIADLGFSKFQTDPANDLNTTYCGTPINMAPEVLNRGMYNYKADVWSLGTIIYEMITGYSPFKEASNKDQLKKRQKTSVIVPKDVQMSKECISFINMCLSYNSVKRPSWIELLNHKFFKNSSDQFINNKNVAGAYDLGSISHNQQEKNQIVQTFSQQIVSPSKQLNKNASKDSNQIRSNMLTQHRQQSSENHFSNTQPSTQNNRQEVRPIVNKQQSVLPNQRSFTTENKTEIEKYRNDSQNSDIPKDLSSDDNSLPAIQNIMLNRLIDKSNKQFLNRSHLSGIDAKLLLSKNRLSYQFSNEGGSNDSNGNGKPRSNFSLQHHESIDKTVRCDSMDKPYVKEIHKDAQQQKQKPQDQDSSDLEWNLDVSSEEIDSQNLSSKIISKKLQNKTHSMTDSFNLFMSDKKRIPKEPDLHQAPNGSMDRINPKILQSSNNLFGGNFSPSILGKYSVKYENTTCNNQNRLPGSSGESGFHVNNESTEQNLFDSGFNKSANLLIQKRKGALKRQTQDYYDELFNEGDEYNNNDNNFWQGYESFTSKRLNPFKQISKDLTNSKNVGSSSSSSQKGGSNIHENGSFSGSEHQMMMRNEIQNSNYSQNDINPQMMKSSFQQQIIRHTNSSTNNSQYGASGQGEERQKSKFFKHQKSKFFKGGVQSPLPKEENQLNQN